jgi:phage-related protein
VNWAGLGRNIIDGIVRGLRAAGSAVKDFLMNIAKGALDSVKRFFGIKSPSRVMADEVGRYLPLGIAQGIEKNASVVEDAMYDLAGDVTAKPVVNAMMTDSRSAGASGSVSSTTNLGGVNISINATDYANAKEIADAVSDIIFRQIKQKGTVFA